MKEDIKLRYQKQLPFASVVALTRTAIKCRDLMKQHMKADFDKPTPYALNAARAVPATKQSMSSAVLLREFGKGTKAEQFLGPEVSGGARMAKRSEKALSSIGALPSGGFATPGSGATLDAYGNQSRGEIVKILSALRAFGEQGYHANRAKGWDKKTRTGQIFAVPLGATRGGLKPGVYKRGPGNTVTALMVFLRKSPTYKVRLPFDKLVEQDALRILPAELDKALHEFGDE